MIIPLRGHIATQDLRKTLNQLRGFQQETGIEVPWKITHAYRKGDEKEAKGPLAPFALNSRWCTLIDMTLAVSESLSGWLYNVELSGGVPWASSFVAQRTQCLMEGSSWVLTSEQNVAIHSHLLVLHEDTRWAHQEYFHLYLIASADRLELLE